MAQFSDTTNKNGLIQKFEFWARLQDGTVTGTLLKQITDRINAAFERIMPLLLQFNDQVRWDDSNHSDAPVAYTDLVANQNDYKFTEDDNSLDILNITSVGIKDASGDTVFRQLERITADDPRVPEILDPDTSVSGNPSGFLELGGRVYLDIRPSSSITSGLQIIFGREQSYFVSTDTTKEPGIPKPFHELLALYAALDYISVFRPSETNSITLIQNEIRRQEKDLKNFIDARHPTKVRMTMKPISHR